MKKFPDHVYMFRDNITRGLEFHGKILFAHEEFISILFGPPRVIDMKSVKGLVVIIMTIKRNCCLRVYSAVKGTQVEWQNHLTMELDEHKSQIAIIDENTVAITVPCRDYIHIVNLKVNKITRINCTTYMTGAIAFINKIIYVAFIGHIQTMNLEGENRVSISLPDIQFLHPVGQNKMYCVRSNNISYLDMTNMEEHQLSEFLFHPECLNFR
ncbi:unnamed protein product [Mytilus coruscus]|uniref:Uncharacterized protein n=1 Tax=Mytilus coruscus TaxID=42192 RepID=A0A6J8CVM6_MYTCO|nr:unnamed protein product [Mytilus coruscus]